MPRPRRNPSTLEPGAGPLRTLAIAAALLAATAASARAQPDTFTRADSLRGALDSPARTWWDVTFYDLHVAIHPADSSIAGQNTITYRVVGAPREDADSPRAAAGAPRELQIDLQAPLVIDSIVQDGRRIAFRSDGDAYFARPPAPQAVGSTRTITVYYHGRPRVAPNPPWDGGFTWATDARGRPWVATSNQGLGASVWWPNKDIGSEEPDSQRVRVRVPDPMIHVGNGRLRDVTHHDDGTTTYEWFVANPINNYAIAVNAGSYAHFEDVYAGEAGELTLDYWVLDYNLEAARRQFQQAKPMLACFEHWFGPYPWYEDGFKLVEVPYLGMEHQSAVTYGNRYENGYLGRDLSNTGLGLEWDYIIVHESAHEWFANNITAQDRADMWVHESFAMYAEALFVECRSGAEAGARYIVGLRGGIDNDRPIIPPYGVNAMGSGDMYPKGANMLHTIRQLVDDDERWRSILRGLNETFRHRTVTGAQVEAYIAERAGLELDAVFDQYLRTVRIPVLEYRIDGRTLSYRWANVVPGFDMPVGVTLGDAAPGDAAAADAPSRAGGPGGDSPRGGSSGDVAYLLLRPTDRWQTTTLEAGVPSSLTVDPDYYVEARRADGG